MTQGGLADTTFHLNIKYLGIVKIILCMTLIIHCILDLDHFLYNSVDIVQFWAIIVSFIVLLLSSIAEFVCIDIKKITNPIVFISLHVITMASIVTFFSIINYKFDDQIYCIVNFGRGYNIVFFVIIGVLEVIYHAFVYAGVSRWVCPDCQKFNKSKAKFCVGCGKVRPAKPNPTPAPAHLTPQHNVTQEPAHQPYASPMPAPQPYTAPRLVSPTQNPGAFCYQCGSPITPGTIFCGQCGKPVN